MKHTESGCASMDGLSLHVACWQPEGEPVGVICLVHGLGEHSARYAHLGGFLAQNGYALFAFDLRGHGKSGGPRGHAPTYDAVMDDVAVALNETSKRFPNRPLFLYGHSLGANLALNYVLRRKPILSGVIATGSLLRTAFKPPAATLFLGKVMYRVQPRLTLANSIDRQALARDPEVVRAYTADPLVHNRLSVRFGMDFMAAGEWALAHAAEWSLPLLLMHGGADRITSLPASREFAAAAGASCTLKVWDGFYHEIHNEPEKQQVFDYLLGWLKAHT
jgi:acylglycerol lipase